MQPLFAFLNEIGMKKVSSESPIPMPADSVVYDVFTNPTSVKYRDKNNLPHKENGPAIIHPDGSTEWWWHGKRHRDDGPAVECANGTKEWYVNNLNHRVGGPAVIKSGGDTLWYFEGRLHREDGPAFVGSDGTRKWYIKGNLHREDGPAIEKKSAINGELVRSFYWEGKTISEPEMRWRAREKFLKINPPKMGQDLTYLCAINGIPHNDNADKPARTWLDGTLEWFNMGRRHRIDGPAVILPNGEEYYYLYDLIFSKQEHASRVNAKEAKPVETIVLESTSPSKEAPPVVPMLPAKEEPRAEVTTEEDEKNKNKVKQWSDEPSEIILYKDIYTPFKNILEKGYQLIRKTNEWHFDYNGYEIGKQEKKLFPNVKEQLSEKFLKREKEKHAQSLMDVVMRLLFLMGVEQGRRMAYQEQAPVRTLEKTLASYRERNKSVRYQLAKANAVIKIREENPALSKEELGNLIHLELEQTRRSRIEEIKKEIKMDSTLTCFKSKVKKKAKLTDLLALANTLDSEIFKQSDWSDILTEANCSTSEWKTFCKKNKFHKFLG